MWTPFSVSVIPLTVRFCFNPLLGLISTSSNNPNNRCLYWLARAESTLLQLMTTYSWLKIYSTGWQRSFTRKAAFGSEWSIVVIALSTAPWIKSGCYPLALVRFQLRPICLRQNASAPNPYLLKFSLTFLTPLCKLICLNGMRWMSGFPWWRTSPPMTISKRLSPRLASSSNSHSYNFVPLSKQKPLCSFKLRPWLLKWTISGPVARTLMTPTITSWPHLRQNLKRSVHCAANSQPNRPMPSSSYAFYNSYS